MGQAAIYIVDYDLPADNRRKRFYRAVHKYRKERNLKKTGFSSQSVIFTQDLDFAEFIYSMARRVGGTSSMWRAALIKGRIGFFGGTGGTER